MAAAASPLAVEIPRPFDMASPAFHADRPAWYRALHEQGPVVDARISVLRLKLVTGYEDCRFVLTDERFVRNRGRARRKPSASPLPVPLPKNVAAVAKSMIFEDDPEHRRHRSLVNKVFTARAVGALEPEVEALCEERLASLAGEGTPDLLPTYARSVPTRVIAAMVIKT